MGDFITKFGVDGKLLLSQTVNFLILLAILRLVAYKPVVEILKKRKARIDEGLANADAADKRLSEIDALRAEEMRKADLRAQELMKETEDRAKEREVELMKNADAKAEHTMQEAKKLIAAKKAQMEEEVRLESIALVKAALVKTVQLDPKSVNDALIKEALVRVQP